MSGFQLRTALLTSSNLVVMDFTFHWSITSSGLGGVVGGWGGAVSASCVINVSPCVLTELVSRSTVVGLAAVIVGTVSRPIVHAGSFCSGTVLATDWLSSSSCAGVNRGTGRGIGSSASCEGVATDAGFAAGGRLRFRKLYDI